MASNINLASLIRAKSFLLTSLLIPWKTALGQQNLVTNGGAETGTTSGWTTNGEWIVSSTNPLGGDIYSFATTALSIPASMSQNLSLSVGATYVASFFAEDCGDNTINLLVGGVSLILQNNVPCIYTQYTSLFTAVSAVEQLLILGVTEAGYALFLDDISVTFVSSPLPSASPTNFPTSTPTVQPSIYPFALPTTKPTEQPTSQPTISPAISPSANPSTYPSAQPLGYPSFSPSSLPSSHPSVNPTSYPSSEPTLVPSSIPTNFPTTEPSSQPSSNPSIDPSSFPSSIPSIYPSVIPTTYPTSYPTSLPTSKPSRAYELVLNYNVQTAIFSTLVSLSGGIILYFAPSFILKNWGYKYKYVYTEVDKESLLPNEIGLYKKEDQLFALHKAKDEVIEYLLEANPRDINDISLTLYQFIWEQLENNPKFKRNPVNSKYKYIYNDAEVNYLKKNEIGLKFTGKLPLLSCDIFCNSEQLTAFRLVDGHLINFPIRIANKEDNGIPKALYHSIAEEYLTLSNSLFTTFEENQIRDFLLVPNRLKPSISVFQKVFCLYTPIYKDLGKAPGFFHNILNCNGYGPEILYRLFTLDGNIPGFIYGVCHNFLKKYQVGLNTRISDDSFAKIAIYIESHLKSEIEVKTVNNIIHQKKKDDLERGKIGSDIDSSSFEQVSSSADMFNRIKKPTSTCIIQAVYGIEFNDPKINDAYNKRLGLEALKELPFLSEETDVKQITQLGNSESYKSDKSSSHGHDINYPNHIIIGTFINARQAIEYIPIRGSLQERTKVFRAGR